MINALFMGGVADGKRMQLADNIQRLEIPEMPDMKSLSEMDLPPDVIPVIQKTIYYRVDVVFLKGVALFTPEMNPTSADLMRTLLNGYREEADPNAE